MGRPKKIEETAEEIDVTPQTDESEGMDIPLKACPRCGGQAGQVIDPHGNHRCHCLECGYWDSVVSHTAKEAAESWNNCGDPNAVEI